MIPGTDRRVDDATLTGLSEPVRGRALWVSWGGHRRSRELASALRVPYYALESSLPYTLRSAVLALKTIFLFIRRRPHLLVVQNPSMVLASIAGTLRVIWGYVLVIDRHSSFREAEFDNPSLKWRLFHALSRYTVRTANLTIVTNDELAGLVTSWGGRPFVLPDKLPTLALVQPTPESRRPRVVFASSQGADEPVREVLEAARLVPDVDAIITGDPSSTRARYSHLIGPNVRFTGYLPEADYQSLLASADVVLALTTHPNTLLCCAYEAVALGRPLVLSNQEVLLRYFFKGRVPCRNTPAGIGDAILTAIREAERLSKESRELALELRPAWDQSWRSLLALLEQLGERAK